MRRGAASVLLMCAILGVASCGGNGDNADTTAPTARTVTKQEYIREGDAICGEIDQKVDAIPTPPPNAPPAEALRFSEQLLTATKPGFDRFKALAAPPADKAIVDQLKAYLDQVIIKLNEEIAAARSRQSQAYFKAADEREAVSNQFAQLAKEYGFQRCGSEVTK